MLHSKQLVMQKLLNTNAHLALRAPYSDRFVPYLYGLRNEMAIIDLENTLISLRRSCHMIGLVIRARGHLLFVNSNSEYNRIIQSTAFLATQSYINHKWMGGLLTNWHHMQNVQHHFQTCFAHTINSDLKVTPVYKVKAAKQSSFGSAFEMHSSEPLIPYGFLSSKTLNARLTRPPKGRGLRYRNRNEETVRGLRYEADVSYFPLGLRYEVKVSEEPKQQGMKPSRPLIYCSEATRETKLLGEARKDSENHRRSYVRLLTADKKVRQSLRTRSTTNGKIPNASRTSWPEPPVYKVKGTAYDNNAAHLLSDSSYNARRATDKGAKESNLLNSCVFNVDELREDTLTGTSTAEQYNTSNINVTNLENVHAFPKNLLRSFPRFKKMQKCFEGLIAKQLPDCVIVLNASQNSIVIHEAKQLRIPIISLVDSNTPHELHQMITYPIPANDDSLKFVYLFCNCILKTILFSKFMLQYKK